MNLLEAIYNALRLPELRNKLLFTGFLLIVFRFFANISIPGPTPAALQALFGKTALLGLLDLFSGGGLSTFSVVAMGLNPYINATIIMQLMQVVSERIKEISKEGEQGRRRITRWSRYLTVALAALQAYGLTVLFQHSNPAILSPDLDWFQRGVIILTLTSGTIMLMWFGELITEHGIGNGISLIIFAGIIGRAPAALINTIQSKAGGGTIADYVPFIVFAIVALIVTAGIIEVQQAVRKVPIQSAQRVAGGSRTVQARASFLPLRVNTAGVIPIIFAISIMFFPTIIANYMAAAPTASVYYRISQWITTNFQPDGPNITMDVVYNLIYFWLVFAFTYFYTAVTFDVNDVADNLKRYSSFIPGIRPGRPTAEYLGSVMNRVTFAGGIFLGGITVILPIATSRITGIPHQQMYLGGTAILIVVGVALDTMKQLETQLIMRQYRGFIR
ncbi:MAG: preprotein translocase subunit SecY [Chloroflexi bacterium]|nr:MAG: preprotein translocase subunit SecY [Chloroflexota bacterium]TME15825.1 MAG: preprotein translocase subunit SecY [Chloroflexota bacterium]TME18066.1 MAG: preprotein translocase subunit SecY [Chloroflexota bacterium]